MGRARRALPLTWRCGTTGARRSCTRPGSLSRTRRWQALWASTGLAGRLPRGRPPPASSPMTSGTC
eukprot:14885080-Alexandrium_andersonii.AAC.1